MYAGGRRGGFLRAAHSQIQSRQAGPQGNRRGGRGPAQATRPEPKRGSARPGPARPARSKKTAAGQASSSSAAARDGARRTLCSFRICPARRRAAFVWRRAYARGGGLYKSVGLSFCVRAGPADRLGRADPAHRPAEPAFRPGPASNRGSDRPSGPSQA